MSTALNRSGSSTNNAWPAFSNTSTRVAGRLSKKPWTSHGQPEGETGVLAVGSEAGGNLRIGELVPQAERFVHDESGEPLLQFARRQDVLIWPPRPAR